MTSYDHVIWIDHRYWLLAWLGTAAVITLILSWGMRPADKIAMALGASVAAPVLMALAVLLLQLFGIELGVQL